MVSKVVPKRSNLKIHHTVSFDRMQELISYFSTQYANQLAVTAVKLVGNREHFFLKWWSFTFSRHYWNLSSPTLCAVYIFLFMLSQTSDWPCDPWPPPQRSPAGWLLPRHWTSPLRWLRGLRCPRCDARSEPAQLCRTDEPAACSDSCQGPYRKK